MYICIYIYLYIYICIYIFLLAIFAWRLVVLSSLSLSTNNIFMLPNTVSENRQWDRCPTRLRTGHRKLAHGHIMSKEQPQNLKTGEDTPLTIKLILTERRSLNNKDANSLALLTKL